MMKFLNRKKGIIMHPATWIVGAFILGLLAMYLIAKGVLPVGPLGFLKP